MGTLQRIFYSLRLAYRHRAALAQLCRHTPRQQSTQSICLDQLYQQGVRALVLDFDGVLAAHGELHPDEGLTTWLMRCIACFGAGHVFVLSNKPLPARQVYLAEHFPGIVWIDGVRKKPYPDGLCQIQQQVQQPFHALALLDDRLLTGGLAAVSVGVRCIYIRHPLRNTTKNSLVELFYSSLRGMERALLWCFS